MTETATALRLERTYAAAPTRVFDAWTDPEVLRRWWAAAPDWECPEAVVDLRVGGRYRLSMRTTEGETHVVGGEYTEVERPARLAYTWAWEQGDGEESQVTVEFRPDGDGTTVVITHAGLTSEESKGRHAHGWSGCLDNLASRGLERV
jgi:uncharacterized protein YndB with AHSA1/START domain